MATEWVSDIPICCRECRHFVPDPIGFGYGIGQCLAFAAFKAKRPRPTPREIKLELYRLGNREDDGDLFWGGELADRRCEEYKELPS